MRLRVCGRRPRRVQYQKLYKITVKKPTDITEGKAMSLEDQYDAWVRSVTGTGRRSATKQDRDAAQKSSLNAMQAQLDCFGRKPAAKNLPRTP